MSVCVCVTEKKKYIYCIYKSYYPAADDNNKRRMRKQTKYNIKIDEIPQEIQINEYFENFLKQCQEFIQKIRHGNEEEDNYNTNNNNVQKYKRRIIIGVVGGAGAGKSSFCSIIEKHLNNQNNNNEETNTSNIAITIGMDGYHFTNEYLNSNFIPGTKDTLLRTIKGDLLSIDVKSIYNDLSKLKINNEKANKIFFPVYDRNLHDPVQNKICVDKHHEIIFFEGLHLLTNDNSYWDQIKALLNGLIILNTPIDICKERVIVRRVTQGKTKEASTKHWEKNDLHIHTRINNAIQTLNTNNLLQNIPTLLLYPCVY